LELPALVDEALLCFFPVGAVFAAFDSDLVEPFFDDERLPEEARSVFPSAEECVLE